MNEDAIELYASLGARPVINAAGAYTVLGGSQLSPGVQAAMETANLYFADMKGLMRSSGDMIAGMLGAEAAVITSGAAAGLALSVAACLTRRHPEYIQRLPDTTGIPNEVIVQKSTRQKYDHCLTLTGGRIVEAGSPSGLTASQIEASISRETAAVHYFVPLQGPVDGVMPIEAVVEVAHAHGLPLIVDAAGHTYPVDGMRQYARAGADLVCYAAKYFGAPHSTGVVTGTREMVDLVTQNSFIGFETGEFHSIGRPMKVDRQEIFATVVALREWLAIDHEQRLSVYDERCESLLRAIEGASGVVEAYQLSRRETPKPVVRDGVRLVLADEASAQQVLREMRDGEPSIWVGYEAEAPTVITVSVAFCGDEEMSVVAKRLRHVLGL